MPSIFESKVKISIIVLLIVTLLLISGISILVELVINPEPSENTTEPIPPLTTTSVPNTITRDSNHEEICGLRFYQTRSPRIVGGSYAKFGDWPWQVYIGSTQFACGGSLLTKYWSVTAAHCVIDETGIFDNITLIFGELNFDDTSEALGHVSKTVDKIVIYEKYDPESPDSLFDIALVKVSDPVPFQENIVPICLPGDTTEDFTGHIGTVTGWGRTYKYDIWDRPALLQVDVPILANDECRKLWQGWPVPKSILCAGFASGGRDACHGDSGGPLSVKIDERFLLVGIVAAGTCGKPNGPGLYTRVTAFKYWILNNTNYNSEP